MEAYIYSFPNIGALLQVEDPAYTLEGEQKDAIGVVLLSYRELLYFCFLKYGLSKELPMYYL